MRRTFTRGFTLVETLIVIVVIGILAALAFNTYGDARRKALNSSRLNEMNAYVRLFQAYKLNNGDWPDMPDGGYCLGTGFPTSVPSSGGVGKCRDINNTQDGVYRYSENTTLMNMLRTAGNVDQGPRQVVKNNSLGPYVQYDSVTSYLTFNVPLEGKASDCVAPATSAYESNGVVICIVQLKKHKLL